MCWDDVKQSQAEEGQVYLQWLQFVKLKAYHRALVFSLVCKILNASVFKTSEHFLV